MTIDRALLMAWRRYHLRMVGEIETALGMPLTSESAGRRQH